MSIVTDHTETQPDLFKLYSHSYAVLDVDPPATEANLEWIDDSEGRFTLEGGVELTEASRRALSQLERDDMKTFERFEDFENYVRNR